MGTELSAGAVEQWQRRDECARNWGLPRRQSSMIHPDLAPPTPASDSSGVAAGADAGGRGGRPWNPTSAQPLAPYTFPDAGGRPWTPLEPR